MKIQSLRLKSFPLPNPRTRVPLNSPQIPKTEPKSVIALELQTNEEIRGIGFSVVPAWCVDSMVHLLENTLAPCLHGEDPFFHEQLWQLTQNRFKSIGWSCLAAFAYAAVDLALWDIKGKILNKPIYQLLGANKTGVKGFLSDIAPLGTDVPTIVRTAQSWLEKGAMGLQIAIGSGDLEADADRVQGIRDALGDAVWLAVTGEERLDLHSTLAIVHYLEDETGIDWLEDPIPLSDFKGYELLARDSGIPLSLGSTLASHSQFRTFLDAGIMRVMRIDPLRLGGLTPFLKLATLAEQASVILSPYRIPEIGLHLACGIPSIQAVDLGSGFLPIWQETPEWTNGLLVPTSKPGLGLEFIPEIWQN